MIATPRRALFLGAIASTALIGAARAQPAPLARGDLPLPGVSIEITRLDRLSAHPVVELRFDIVNGGSEPATLAALGLERQSITARGVFGSVGGIQLLDMTNAIRYAVGGDSAFNLATRWSVETGRIAPGERRSFWAWFGAPPAGVTRLSVAPPGAPPLMDLPLGSR